MLVLDTHVLLWLAAGDRRLGPRAVRALDRACAKAGVGVSSLSYWEIETLVLSKRVRGVRSAEEIRSTAVGLGIEELDVDGSIAIEAARLRGFHGDPVDRVIVATTQLRDAALVTADAVLLGWGRALKTVDATR